MRLNASSVLGIDGGGSRSRGVLLSLSGVVLALESAGPSNYVGVGAKPAREALQTLIEKLTAAARRFDTPIVAGGFGLSGVDRPKDSEAFSRLLTEAGAVGWPTVLVNDAYLALRAGTPDGVGVAAVSGTGCNTVGVDARGRHERVGGLGFEFGDFGGSTELGVAALRAAIRGEDGRGPKTALGERLRRDLQVPSLDELMDRTSPDTTVPFAPRAWVPALFEVAEAGDAVARDLLRFAGHEIGVGARLVAERLFAKEDSFPLVLGGRVLAEGGCDAMRDALVAEVRSRFPNLRPVRLHVDPVLGAALLAIDCLAAGGNAAAPSRWPDAQVTQRAQETLLSKTALA